MFVCDFCSKPIGPRIKPLMIVPEGATRSKSYSNKIETPPIHPGGKSTYHVKGSAGFERIVEFKSCHECQGLKPVETPSTTITPIANVTGMHTYARNSKKRLDEDYLMRQYLELYKTFPKLNLAVSLQDDKVSEKKWGDKIPTFAYVAVENLMRRGEDADKGHLRAKADFIVGYGLLKSFELTGGKV